MAVKNVIPKKYYTLVRSIYSSIKYFGLRFKCPCCGGNFRKFLSCGIKLRRNALCPRCGSLERHRLLYLYLKDKTNFFSEQLRVFDIAPMYFFAKKCKKLKKLNYISVDILSPIAMVKMDIRNISFSNNQFDCIICYHVLEHILDDEKAMRELYRILKPGGWAILQSPIDYNREKTLEDSNIVSPTSESVFLDKKAMLGYMGKTIKIDLKRQGLL